MWNFIEALWNIIWGVGVVCTDATILDCKVKFPSWISPTIFETNWWRLGRVLKQMATHQNISLFREPFVSDYYKWLCKWLLKQQNSIWYGIGVETDFEETRRHYLYRQQDIPTSYIMATLSKAIRLILWKRNARMVYPETKTDPNIGATH